MLVPALGLPETSLKQLLSTGRHYDKRQELTEVVKDFPSFKEQRKLLKLGGKPSRNQEASTYEDRQGPEASLVKQNALLSTLKIEE